jgi:hypothetical protein
LKVLAAYAQTVLLSGDMEPEDKIKQLPCPRLLIYIINRSPELLEVTIDPALKTQLERFFKSDDIFPDKWQNLGGKVELGERLEESIQREIFEEHYEAIHFLHSIGLRIIRVQIEAELVYLGGQSHRGFSQALYDSANAREQEEINTLAFLF